MRTSRQTHFDNCLHVLSDQLIFQYLRKKKRAKIINKQVVIVVQEGGLATARAYEKWEFCAKKEHCIKITIPTR